MKKKFDNYYVLDTNIILNEANFIISLAEEGKNLIILPETVIDELDTKKTLMTEIGYQARDFGRLLSKAVVTDKVVVGNDKNVTVMQLMIDKICIHIISFRDYKLGNVDRGILNDRQIIKVTSFASTYYKTPEATYLLSEDIMCRTRAISLGVQSRGIINKQEMNFKYIKTLEVSAEMFNSLFNKPIIEVDADYVQQNYCYIFHDSTKNYSVFGIIKGGLIQMIDENELRKSDIKPINVGQMFAMSGILTPFDVTIIEAKSGSGKNVLSIAGAMRLIDKGLFKKIIYIRNSIASVEKNAEIGFLPGSQAEKMKIYNHPLYDTIEFIATESIKKKKKDKDYAIEALEAKTEELIAKYQIEAQWIGELRGRTLSNAVVILDEAQNFSISSLNTILTRIGRDSKVIAIGSNTQIDNAYLSVNSNGLTKLLMLACEEQEIELFATNLEKAVRGPIVEWSEEKVK
jgi:PhoH-like ATPase